MAAISKARHYKLTGEIAKSSTVSSIILLSDNAIIDLKEEANQLQQLYETYSLKLSEVQKLIKEYELMQRKIKVKLRKQQIKHLKQKLGGSKNNAYQYPYNI